jgi:GNAT superfamily N-acetyltransferase
MADRELQRMAMPTSWSADNKTATVILSTDRNVGDGFVLVHTKAAIRWPERPLPVVLDHITRTDAVIGAITGLQLERQDGATSLVGQLVLDGPAAAQAEPLLRTGAARWSIGARIHKLQRDPGTGLERATEWSPSHLALVVEPQDEQGITRSISSPMTTENSTSTSTETVERSAKEIKRERDVLRLGQTAGLTTEQTEELIRSDRSVHECSVEAVRLMRIRLENGDCTKGEKVLGHPARTATPGYNRDMGGILAAKLGVRGDDVDRSLASVPLGLVLRDHLAADPDHRGLDLARMPVTRLIERAFSTGDFVKSLEANTERLLLQAYQEAQTGVMMLATSVELADFRSMEAIRVSQYGEIHEKGQGGEYKTSSYSEELAATLQASEYGSIAVLTRRALANDNLGIFSQLVTEMGRSAARKERKELAQRLLTGFTWGSGNSTSTTAADATGIIAGISAATLKLRRQVDVDGNPVSFSPSTLLVAPENEAAARQALGTYNPTTAGNVMPFPMLSVEVDHYLPGGVFYVHDSAYPSLVIGRIGGGPILSDSEDFETGNRKYRVQSDFGTAVMDQRSIVKVTVQS